MSAIASFRARLRIAMKEAGLDQSALAKLVGGSPGLVNGWYREGLLPQGKHMVTLPAALRVSGHWLLTGEGTMNPPDQKAVSLHDQARAEAVEVIRRRVASALREALAPVTPASIAYEKVSAELVAYEEAIERAEESEHLAAAKKKLAEAEQDQNQQPPGDRPASGTV